MTLTRTPCELDKMSLFQDLKLKRRKVDSRCSSDGKKYVRLCKTLVVFRLKIFNTIGLNVSLEEYCKWSSKEMLRTNYYPVGRVEQILMFVTRFSPITKIA